MNVMMHGASRRLETPRRLQSQAFTFTDLIVIAAICVLMLLLTSAVVARPGQASRDAVCLDNLRRISMASVMYCSDNDDFIALGNVSVISTGWLYKYVVTSGQPRVDGGLLWAYLGNSNVYMCPVDDTNTSNFNSRNIKFSSYLMNYAVNGYGGLSGNRTYKLSQFLPDAVLFWEPSDSTPFYFNDGVVFPSEGTGSRHYGGGHLGTFDGRSEYISYKDFYTEVANTKKNRLWCSPRTFDGR